ncbi:hypothetical protein, partial [Vibrio genomosp. F10]|uniref:hypothetical protein n=1 Tax=Vibrio genomosp. F10 TaxID=723171 RepID=UPI001969D00F
MSNVDGLEDKFIALGIKLTDSMSTVTHVEFSDIPEGATIKIGNVETDIDSKGSMTVDIKDINNIEIKAPEHSDVDFDISVTAKDIAGAIVETGSVNVKVIADTDKASLTIEEPADLTEGFLLEQWDRLEFDYNNGAGVDPSEVEAKIESAGTPNRAEMVQTPDLNVGVEKNVLAHVSSKLTGLVYLVADQEYVFSGRADDSFRLEIGGETLASGTWGSLGSSGYESAVFTPTASGWYSVTAFHDNEAGPGSATFKVKVGDAEPVEFNTTNFDIVPDVSHLEGIMNLAPMVEHSSDEGGYYPAFDINEGLEDTFIHTSTITTQLTDVDGSESLTLVLSGLLEGSIVKLGDSELVVGENGEVDISSWLASGGTIESILAGMM